MRDYTNSEMRELIDEHIHSERDRLIMKLCFIDGYSYENIAARKAIDLSPRQVSNIINKNMEQLNKYLE